MDTLLLHLHKESCCPSLPAGVDVALPAGALCRELGFIICYGAIVLKLYRHLVEFRTRKAHRWVVRDLDLLRYLCAMCVAVLCYLAAFTATSMDFLRYSELVWKVENTDDQVTSNMCRPLKWDYVTEAGELLILGFGLQLAIASRNAILNFGNFNPSTLFLALFIRSQLTNTVTLALIFLPKLWYQHKQVRSLAHEVSFRLPVDAFKGAHDSSHHGGGLGTYAGICVGDPEVGDVTISEMSPEDIRAELKRLYTQLEYLKNKTLRQDNPHISKRRGGRKVAHRRFSLQKKGSREKALSAKHRNNRPAVSEVEVTEAEPSRTPEDSVCSVEGPTDTGTMTGAEISGVSSSK
nr:probable G-protein coupled receptor 158 [Aedes albopictus]